MSTILNYLLFIFFFSFFSFKSLKSCSSKSLSSFSKSSESIKKKSKSSNINAQKFEDTVLQNVPSEKSLKYNYGYKTVLEKLEKYINKVPEMEKEIINEFGSKEKLAIVLSDKDKFKKCFFGEYSKTLIANEIEKILESLKGDFTAEEIINFENNIKNSIKAMNDQKLEFRLSPLEITKVRILGQFIRSSANVINKSGATNWNYGAFHSLLSLNGIILEWDTSSLVIPHLDFEKMVYFSLEIKEGFLWRVFKKIKNALINITNFITSFINKSWYIKDIVERELDSICQACVAFNTDRYYSLNKVNCQFFVNSVLKAIGVELKFEGEMEREMNYFRTYGELDFKFKENEFKTRKQLDDFAKKYFYILKNDEKKLLFLFKSTFEAKRIAKIDKETGNFENANDEIELGTTKEAEEMWKKFEINDKIGEKFWSYLQTKFN